MKFERWLDVVPRFTIRKSGQMCHDTCKFTEAQTQALILYLCLG